MNALKLEVLSKLGNSVSLCNKQFDSVEKQIDKPRLLGASKDIQKNIQLQCIHFAKPKKCIFTLVFVIKCLNSHFNFPFLIMLQ